MSATTNAAPQNIPLGTEDFPGSAVSPIESYAQHLPKFFIHTPTGPEDEVIVNDGADIEKNFGADALKQGSEYYNHQTLFLQRTIGAGGSAMVQRVKMAGSVKANAVLFLELKYITEDVDFQRNSLGNIDVTETAETVNVTRVELSWSVDTVDLTTITNGDPANIAVVAGGGNDPVRYPIMFVEDNSYGLLGNLTGVRQYGHTSDNPINPELITKQNTRSLLVQLTKKPDAYSSTEVIKTIFSEREKVVSFNPDAKNPATGTSIYIKDIIDTAYSNTTDSRYEIVQPPLGRVHVFDANVLQAIEDITSVENATFNDLDAVYDTSLWNLDDTTVNPHMMNLFDMKHSSGVEYFSTTTVVAADVVGETRKNLALTPSSGYFMAGGKDYALSGSLTKNDLYNQAVIANLERYADIDDSVQDVAYNVESIFYDSGFPMGVKDSFYKLISKRKDTAAVYGTHIEDENDLTASEESSRAKIMLASIRLAKESTFFGTEVCRAMIFGYSGDSAVIPYSKRVGTNLDFLVKATEWMGASNGAWTPGNNFEGSPGHIVSDVTNISIRWTPVSTRVRYWDDGLTVPLRFGRATFFWPSYQTAYPDDTSILNNGKTMIALTNNAKILESAWREHSGISGLTDAEFTSVVEDFILRQLAKRTTDDQYEYRVAVTIDEENASLGYEWTAVIDLIGGVSKTVQKSYTRSFRFDNA